MRSMDDTALRLAYDIAYEIESTVRSKLTFDQFNAILGKVKKAAFDGFISESALCMKIVDMTC